MEDGEKYDEDDDEDVDDDDEDDDDDDDDDDVDDSDPKGALLSSSPSVPSKFSDPSNI